MKYKIGQVRPEFENTRIEAEHANDGKVFVRSTNSRMGSRPRSEMEEVYNAIENEIIESQEIESQEIEDEAIVSKVIVDNEIGKHVIVNKVIVQNVIARDTSNNDDTATGCVAAFLAICMLCGLGYAIGEWLLSLL